VSSANLAKGIESQQQPTMSRRHRRTLRWTIGDPVEQLAIIPRSISGVLIGQRSDGYINATQLCKAAEKLIGHYLENKATTEFLQELSAVIGIPITELVVKIQGGKPELQGTWAHPNVAVHLAQWLSPAFAVQVTAWVIELATTGRVELPGANPTPLYSPKEIVNELLSALDQRAKVCEEVWTVEGRCLSMGYFGSTTRDREKILQNARRRCKQDAVELPVVDDRVTVFRGIRQVKALDEAIGHHLIGLLDEANADLFRPRA
jgi:hypothetical protein